MARQLSIGYIVTLTYKQNQSFTKHRAI